MALSIKTNQLAGPAATGSQAITDPGFTPKLLLQWHGLQTALGATAGAQFYFGNSIGSASTAGSGYNSKNAVTTSVPIRLFSQSKVPLATTTGTATTNLVANPTTFDTNGWTSSWTTLTTASPLFNYLALGGTDITNVKMGSFTSNTTTGNQAVSAVGFKPDIVFLYGNFATAAAQSSITNSWGWGVMTATGQWAMGQKSQSGVTTTNTSRSFDNTSCFIIPSTTATSIAHQLQFVSMDSNGFTVNLATASGVACVTEYIAIKGGQWEVGTDTQKTSTGTKATTGVGFTPAAVMLGSVADTQTAGSASHARLALGMTDGTNNTCLWTGDQNGLTTSIASTIMSNTKCLVLATEAATPTTNAEAALSSMDSNGFTLNWTTADATARVFGYVAIGASAQNAGFFNFMD